MGYGKVSKPFMILVINIFITKMEGVQNKLYRILKGIKLKIIIFWYLNYYLPVFYGIKTIKCKKSKNIF